MSVSAPTAPARTFSPLTVPFLALLGAIQGAAPNISSTALVGASRGLDMAGGTQAIAASAQTLAIAASVISTGLLADRIGRRKVLIGSLILGILGNLTIAAAPVAGVYVLGQAMTGVGLGAVYAAAFAYIRIVTAPEKIASAVGLFAAISGLGAVAFTFIGGTMVSNNWRLGFVLLPIVSLIALVIVPLLLPADQPETSERRDVLGQVFLAGGLVSFLYGASKLANSLTSLETWIPIVLGVVLLGLFVWSQHRVTHPFFPVELFRRPIFIAAICAGFVYNFGNAVAFLQITNLWQYVLGLKTAEVSVWQLPLMASGIIAAVIFGRWMGNGLSIQAALLIGVSMTTLGFLTAALTRDSTTLLGFVPGGVLIGAGIIITSLPYGNLILSEAPKEFFGPVTSSRTTFGQLFYSIGLAMSTVVLDQLTHGGVVQRLTTAGVPADQIGTGLDAVTTFASTGTRPETSLGQQALKAGIESYLDAFGSMMFLAAALSAVVGITGYLLLRHGLKQAAPSA